MGSERRRHARQSKDAPLVLLRRGPAPEGAVLRDVSLGGLAFETAERLEPGSLFDFALYVPTQGWVDGTGSVRWVKRAGRGWLCGASVTIQREGQRRLYGKWLRGADRGLLRWFFPERP